MFLSFAFSVNFIPSTFNLQKSLKKLWSIADPFPLCFLSCRFLKPVISMWLGEKGHVVTEIHPSNIPNQIPQLSHFKLWNFISESSSELFHLADMLDCFLRHFPTLMSILILTSFKKWNSQPVFFQSVIVLSPELVWYSFFHTYLAFIMLLLTLKLGYFSGLCAYLPKIISVLWKQILFSNLKILLF